MALGAPEQPNVSEAGNPEASGAGGTDKEAETV
jgi:hypothetical protein